MINVYFYNDKMNKSSKSKRRSRTIRYLQYHHPIIRYNHRIYHNSSSQRIPHNKRSASYRYIAKYKSAARQYFRPLACRNPKIKRASGPRGRAYIKLAPSLSRKSQIISARAGPARRQMSIVTSWAAPSRLLRSFFFREGLRNT